METETLQVQDQAEIDPKLATLVMPDKIDLDWSGCHVTIGNGGWCLMQGIPTDKTEKVAERLNHLTTATVVEPGTVRFRKVDLAEKLSKVFCTCPLPVAS